MSFEHTISVISALMSFAGLMFVAVQMRIANRQRQSDSLVKILDVNRELISLGFSHPELFHLLAGKKPADPLWTQRYLQLWLNQFSLVHSYLEHSVLAEEARANLERDLSEFMAIPPMRQHWQRFGKLYPASFQSYINAIFEKDEPPAKAAHPQASPHAAKT